MAQVGPSSLVRKTNTGSRRCLISQNCIKMAVWESHLWCWGLRWLAPPTMVLTHPHPRAQRQSWSQMLFSCTTRPVGSPVDAHSPAPTLANSFIPSLSLFLIRIQNKTHGLEFTQVYIKNISLVQASEFLMSNKLQETSQWVVTSWVRIAGGNGQNAAIESV